MLRESTPRTAAGERRDASARPRASILLLALLCSLAGIALAAASAEPPVQPVHFSVIGDTPYSEDDVDALVDHIDSHNSYSNSEFLVHVGDIKAQGDECTENHYTRMADILRMLAVPGFILPGDNEWTDCLDPDQGWAYWEQHLLGIEQDFCGTPPVASQSARPANFAFFQEDVLFIGITMLSGLPSSVREESANWIETQFSENAASARAVVILGQKEASGPVFDAVVERGADYGGPILYIHGNGHEWQEDPAYFGLPNVLRVQVDRGTALAPPVHVTVTETGSFVFDRDPWPPGTQPLNRAPCADAGPDLSIGLSETAQLQGLATDDGVPGSPGSLTVTWRSLSGPGPVSFADPSAPATTATFGVEGTYTLELLADDGELTGSSTLQVRVGSGGGGGGQVTVHEVVTGGSSALASVSTTASVAHVEGDLYLAAIAAKSDTAVTNVSGLGLSWSPVRSQCGGRGQTGVSVWQAWGDGGGDDIVTASLAEAPTNAVIAVSRFSGAGGLGGVGAANTLGASGACSGGVDTDAYAFDLSASGSSSAVYAVSAMRSKDHEPGSAYTERAEIHHGASGGETAGLAVSDREVAAPGPVAVNGTFNRTVDWAVVALEILAATAPTEEFRVSVSPATGGSVTLDPPGGRYAAGTSVTLTAVPDAGFGFGGWSGDLSGSANPEILVVDSDKTVAASFTSQRYTLNVAPSSGGSVTLDPPGGSYLAGTLVSVGAVPDPGNVFVGWSGDLSGFDNPEALLVDADKSVSAGFAPAVTLNVTPTAGGSVTLDPPGGVYAAGTVVTVTAVPDAGFVFSGWSGALTGSVNPELVVADVDKTIGASFAVQQFDVNVVPSTGGSVTLDPPGGSYDAGSVVGVTATAAPGYVFTGWGGDLSGTANPESLRVDADKSISASFSPTVTLTVTAATDGSVVLDPPGGVYAAGTSVTLTAVADPGYGFVGWGGDLSGTTNPQALVVDVDKSVSASFAPTFAVTLPAQSGGSVTLDPPGGVYTAGTRVSVTAVADPGFAFASWGGDLSGSENPTTLVVDADKTVTARFDAVYTLSVRASGGGSVDLDPPGGSYLEGTLVTLTAVPNGGKAFTGWSGDLSGSANPETIVMDGHKSVRARFGRAHN